MIEDYHKQYTKGLRRRVVEITPTALAQLCTPQLFLECTKGLPEDCRVVAVTTDTLRNNICLLVESNTFEEIPEGGEFPRLAVEFKSYWGKELQVIRQLIKNVKTAQMEEGEEHA